MVKGIVPESRFRSPPLLVFSDDRWAEIKQHSPEPLSAEADTRLRDAITGCCSRYLQQRAHFQESVGAAAAVRAGNKRPALLEKLAKELRAAANTWAKIGKIHND